MQVRRVHPMIECGSDRTQCSHCRERDAECLREERGRDRETERERERDRERERQRERERETKRERETEKHQ